MLWTKAKSLICGVIYCQNSYTYFLKLFLKIWHFRRHWRNYVPGRFLRSVSRVNSHNFFNAWEFSNKVYSELRTGKFCLKLHFHFSKFSPLAAIHFWELERQSSSKIRRVAHIIETQFLYNPCSDLNSKYFKKLQIAML